MRRHALQSQADGRGLLLAPLKGPRGPGLLHGLGQDASLVEGLAEVLPAHPEDSIVHGAVTHLRSHLRVRGPAIRAVAPCTPPLGGEHALDGVASLAMRVPEHDQLHGFSVRGGRELAGDQGVGVAEHKPILPKVACEIRRRIELRDRGSHDVVPGIVIQKPRPELRIAEALGSIRHNGIALAGRLAADVLRPGPVPPPKDCLRLTLVFGWPHEAIDNGEAGERHEGIGLRPSR
mmetsp:Transcript_29271/g.97255  ORF Transcript_29271/g.97255 Transcript_29271/m.97255 type:complete len:234 (-) Transcript_29271:794-1495(-)